MENIKIIYSARKTLCLEVRREEGGVVRAPRRTPQKEIDAFVKAHEDWIARALQRTRQRQQNLPQYPESEAEIRRLKAKAAQVIPPKVDYYARFLGVTPGKVGITRAKTRYGSCSGKNSLNFSCFLMLFSDRAIDYVVVHELCHIKHKNHSKQFYEMIAGVMPDYRMRQKELRGR